MAFELRANSENLVLAGLCAASGALAATMALLGRATWLEATAFVTGALCVWLVVQESIWNFPIALVNVATFSVVLYRSRLFADAGLQVVYFALGIMGWRLWLRGGAGHAALRIGRTTATERWLLALFVVCATGALWQLAQRVGGSASFWDALTTSLSLASQWLLNRKRIENWIGWIVVDAIYVPLYLYKELYLTAILYAVYLVMSVMGLRAWRSALR
jgi:nicotinamide mononucleotide transporter